MNGFVSELLIYLGAFAGLLQANVADGALPWAAVLVIGALALIGGLAAACFTKACGVVFLGEPRTVHAAQAHEVGWAMRLPLVLLASGCILIGLCGWLLPRLLTPVVAEFLPATMAGQAGAGLAVGTTALGWAAVGAASLLTLVGLLALGRARLLAGREIGRASTWDCGYAAPQARMQYTASSFAQPLVNFWRFCLRTHKEVQPPRGLFPDRARLHTHTPDVFREGLFRPLFAGTQWLAVKLHWLQHGRIQAYVLYIALTLLVLLVWKLR